MNSITSLTPDEQSQTIGLTTTVPVEVIMAAGLRPIDLNNIFITSGEAGALVEEAERRGFPRNCCAWNKGIYAAARRLGLKRVVGVVQGDCANTHAMMEMLQSDGVEVIPFAFPYSPDDTELMDLALQRFASALGTTLAAAEEQKSALDTLRAKAHRVDELAWRDGKVSGAEQHLWTISCSDFFSDPRRFQNEIDNFLAEAEQRTLLPHAQRLALIGIPPICDGLFEFLESRGARVVFNEIPRQFTMPHATASLSEQYRCYTYPYDVFHRLDDIKRELDRRRISAVIHYVQSFCFRQVQDAIIRRELDLPILTLECDRPGPLDMRTKTRIEAFLEMLPQSANASDAGAES